MNRSIFFRLFTASVILVGLVTIAYMAATFAVARQSYLLSTEDHLRSLAVSIGAQISPVLAANRFRQAQELVTALEPRIQRRITVIKRDGTVVADSEGDPHVMENHGGRPEVIAALSGTVGSATRLSATINEEMLYVAVLMPSSVPGGTTYVIRVSMFLRDFNAFMDRLQSRLIRSSALILLAALGGALMLSRALARPLRKLQAAAETMSQGDFSARVQIRSSREITALGDAFNQMAARINTLFGELSARTEELNTILAAVPEPLFAVDNDGKILHANDSFKTLCSIPAWEGKYYWEAFRAEGFESLIKKALASGDLTAGSFTHAGRSYLCSISKISSRDEYVILLHDVTEERRVQAIKKDFISNVSHELRTPLTAIKGFVETLNDMVEGDGTRYLNIIARHTDRLIRIVEDLLLLSELENPLFKLELKSTGIPDMIRDIVTIFQPRAREKGLRIIVETPPTLRPAMVDPFRFEQALINLVDNAVKYTDKGDIRISVTEKPGTMKITVSDSGAGIPPEAAGRIFERFFVVDPSRSRKMGGTGLGLSIVKHIVTLHGGTIDVNSIPGTGSTFTITIPG